jgi:uncharacterized membrane protein (DUF373 family)
MQTVIAHLRHIISNTNSWWQLRRGEVQVVDLIVLGVILLFLDINRWKLRKRVKDVEQTQKRNYKLKPI